jgi:aryl-alcohol dehydrogenase-like predicted oxidoreductase
VRFGDTEVRRIGLGTNRLTFTPTNLAFVKSAVEAGIDLIDTAHLYTGGDSEETIGAAVGEMSRKPFVETKGGFRPGEGKPDALRQQIEQSLRRLATDRIDLYYLHRVDPETTLEDSLRTIKEYVDAGQIDLVGLSAVNVQEIERGRAVLPIAAVQNEYNLSQRRSDDVVDYCARESIVFVPYSPLHGSSPRLAEIARAHGASQQQIALAWLLHRSSAMLPIPGSLSLAHVRENIAALDIELTDEEFAALR